MCSQGSHILLLGSATVVKSPLPSLHSFQQFLMSQRSMAWVFDKIQMAGFPMALAESIRRGQCICITDGSYKDSHGTAAWKLIDLERPETFITGQCIISGTSSQQCPYQSELAGLYATVVTTNAVIDFFDITDGSVILACDNKSAIHVTSFPPDGTNPSKCHHFDLVLAIQSLKSKSIHWNHQHVDGHMDNVTDHILSPLEILNVEMDKMAKEYWAETCRIDESSRLQFFEGEPWPIVVGNEKLVSGLSSTLTSWCQRPRIQEFWVSKGRFPSKELSHVDYVAAACALKSASLSERRKVTKHAHGYCAVNKMMMRWRKQTTSQCPQCNEPVEDVTHVWLCRGHESMSKWDKCLKDLEKYMFHSQTDPILSRIILTRLASWSVGSPCESLNWVPDTYLPLLNHQDRQGWHNFFMGLPSTGWSKLQDQYYLHLAVKNTGRRWLTAIIRKLWQIAWDILAYRNSFIHDQVNGDEVSALRQQIVEEYAKGPPTKDTKKLFKLSLECRLKTSLDHQSSTKYSRPGRDQAVITPCNVCDRRSTPSLALVPPMQPRPASARFYIVYISLVVQTQS